MLNETHTGLVSAKLPKAASNTIMSTVYQMIKGGGGSSLVGHGPPVHDMLRESESFASISQLTCTYFFRTEFEWSIWEGGFW